MIPGKAVGEESSDSEETEVSETTHNRESSNY